MFPLNNKYIWALTGLLMLWVAACAPKRLTPHYETPPPDLKVEDNRLYYKALDAQNRGRLKEAEELWQVFLKRYPDSVHGHNNLGRVYYLEDKLTQATQQFEQGLALEPADPRLRQNLADALKLQANLLYEDKRFDATIQKLDRLREISPQEEQQGIQIRIEKVEDKIYEQVRKVDTPESYRDFLQKYPEGINAQRARQRLKELDGGVESSGLSSLIPGMPDLFGTESESMEMPMGSKTPPVTPETVTPQPEVKPKEMATFKDPFTEETLPEVPVSGKITPGKKGMIEEEPVAPSGDSFFDTENFGKAGVQKPLQEKPESTEVAKTEPESPLQKKKVKPYGSEVTDEALDDFLKSLDDQDIQVQPSAPKPEAVEPMDQTSEVPLVPESGEIPVTQLTEPVEMPESVPPSSSNVPSLQTEVQDVPEELEMIAPFEALAKQEPKKMVPDKTKKVPLPKPKPPVQVTEKKKSGPGELPVISSVEVENQALPQTATLDNMKPTPPQTLKKKPDPVPGKLSASKEKSPARKKTEAENEKLAKKEPAPPAEKVMVEVDVEPGTYLNVRSRPSVENGKLIGKLKDGDTVPLVRETTLWFQVEYQKGKQGWISRTYSHKLSSLPPGELMNYNDAPSTVAS